MPCFNTGDYIERSIQSVMSQDYPYFDLYIKDGGSKDKTLQIIKRYAKKYPKKISWISKKDSGQTDAINYGIKKTSGEILAYLNADDVYKPGALKVIAKSFSKNPAIKWVIGKADIIDDNNQTIRGLITLYKNIWLNNYSYSTLLILNYISQMAVFWKRDVIKEIGLFDPKQYYVMDYEYWLRLGKKYPPLLLNEYIASFRIVSNSKSSTGFLKQFEDELRVAQKHSSNKLLLNLHRLHIKMITSIYRLMRKT